MVDAIRKDAEEEKVVDLNDPQQRFSRDEAMKAMAARRRETVAEDMAPGDYTALTEGEEAPVLEVDPAKQIAAQTKVVSEEDIGQLKVKLKVNGEEREVTVDQMRELAQINDAGRKFLADAKRMYEDAAARKAAWEAKQQEAPKAEAPVVPATPSPETTEKVRAAVKAGVEKMFAGDDTGSVDGFVEGIMAALPQQVAAPAPVIDVNAIAKRVTQQVTIDGALRQFTKDFADIQAPEQLEVADRQLFIATNGKALEELPADKISEVLERAGKMTRTWFGLPDPKPVTGSTATTREEKAARKEKIDELPSAATRSTSTVPQPLTPSERIAQMQKARGQGLRDPTQR